MKTSAELIKVRQDMLLNLFKDSGKSWVYRNTLESLQRYWVDKVSENELKGIHRTKYEWVMARLLVLVIPKVTSAVIHVDELAKSLYDTTESLLSDVTIMEIGMLNRHSSGLVAYNRWILTPSLK